MAVTCSGNGHLYSGGDIPAACVPVCKVCTLLPGHLPGSGMSRDLLSLSLQALPGPHYYTWGDHGGIIMAIAQGMETNELK